MQELRIIVSGSLTDRDTAQAVTDAIMDVVNHFDGLHLDAAPWTEDLSAARRAEFQAEQAAEAATQAAANQTAVDQIAAALDADPSLSDEQKSALASTIQAATGTAVKIGPAPLVEKIQP